MRILYHPHGRYAELSRINFRFFWSGACFGAAIGVVVGWLLCAVMLWK